MVLFFSVWCFWRRHWIINTESVKLSTCYGAVDVKSQENKKIHRSLWWLSSRCFCANDLIFFQSVTGSQVLDYPWNKYHLYMQRHAARFSSSSLFSLFILTPFFLKSVFNKLYFCLFCIVLLHFRWRLWLRWTAVMQRSSFQSQVHVLLMSEWLWAETWTSTFCRNCLCCLTG